MSKCIICGGRDFAIQQFSPNVAEKLESGLRAIFTAERVDEEVCGMARGADEYGASFAKQLGIPVKEFPAYWDNTISSQTEPVSIGVNKHGDKYNKIAGINRNRRMAEYASSFPNGIVVALPGGSGTAWQDASAALYQGGTAGSGTVSNGIFPPGWFCRSSYSRFAFYQ